MSNRAPVDMIQVGTTLFYHRGGHLLGLVHLDPQMIWASRHVVVRCNFPAYGVFPQAQDDGSDTTFYLAVAEACREHPGY